MYMGLEVVTKSYLWGLYIPMEPLGNLPTLVLSILVAVTAMRGLTRPKTSPSLPNPPSSGRAPASGGLGGLSPDLGAIE